MGRVLNFPTQNFSVGTLAVDVARRRARREILAVAHKLSALGELDREVAWILEDCVELLLRHEPGHRRAAVTGVPPLSTVLPMPRPPSTEECTEDRKSENPG